MLIHEVFLIYAYTAPLSVQSRLINEKPYEVPGWPYFRQNKHVNLALFKDALRLFLEEISLRTDSSIDLDELLGLCEHFNISTTSSMEDFLINCLESRQFKEPLRMESLLKTHGLPSKIPTIKKVFRASETILSAIKSSFDVDLNISVDIDGLNPIWSQIVLPALNVKEAGHDAGLPDCVLQQAQLYLATSKSFLLFKFDPSLVRPDSHYSFGDLSYVQKWAKKLATRLVASSMLLAGKSENLATLPSSAVNLEVKDAARATNFQLYEPISAEFTGNVEFMNGVRTALQLSKVKDTIESFWVFKQLPADGNFIPEHAGLIFGLGLIGGLASFKAFDAYELLSAGSEDISSAVLLGLALSNIGKGTASGFIPQMLGLHVPGCLPAIDGNGPQLANVALSTQTSALLSLGFLFKGSGNRGIAILLIRELDRLGPISSKSRVRYSPAYTLAAGLAFGLVNIDPETSALDEETIGKLIGMLDSSDDYKVPSAFFAMLSLFAGTRDTFVTSRISNPDVNNYGTKPLFIFLRVLLHSLILGAFPLDLNSLVRLLKASLEKESDTFDLDTRITNLCYIIAAYAMFLGLRCAGTADPKATEQLLKLYSVIGKRHSEDAFHLNYSSKYRSRNVAFLKDLLLLSLALINSGTGDKEVFSLLRSHFMSILEENPSRAYIHHLALGWLVLGEGKSIISTGNGKDSAAMTSIMASVYAAFNYPFLEDSHFSPIYFMFLWNTAVSKRTPSKAAVTELGQSPEDLFFSDVRPSRADYVRAKTGSTDLWKMMNPADLDFLSRLATASSGKLFSSDMQIALQSLKL